MAASAGGYDLAYLPHVFQGELRAQLAHSLLEAGGADGHESQLQRRM